MKLLTPALIIIHVITIFLLTQINSTNTLLFKDNDEPTSQKEEDKTTARDESSLIVCGVDGIVYTLNAWSGQLRGMFSSGQALITSSSSSSDLDEAPYRRVIPGLDGQIYTLKTEDDESSTAGIHLELLPVSVRDVTESPVSTCDDAVSGEGEEECGILMGEKRSTVFALDISTGSVQWTHHPRAGSGKSSSSPSTTTTLADLNYALMIPSSPSKGGRSDTNPGSSSKSSKKKAMLLLQREDYFVKQVDVDSGQERWNISVSHFHALDFTASSSTKDKNEDDVTSTHTKKQWGDSKIRRSITSSAALEKGIVAAPKRTISMSRFGRMKRDVSLLHPHDRHDFYESFLSGNHYGASVNINFPLIAFGQDGNSIIAVDPSTHEFLWKRQLNTVVAAVYGGQEESWIPIDVVDEEDILYSTDSSSRNEGMLQDREEKENDFNKYPSKTFLLPNRKEQKPFTSPSSKDLVKSYALLHNDIMQHYYFPVLSPSLGLPSTIGTSTKAARLGHYANTLFVASVLQHQQRKQQEQERQREEEKVVDKGLLPLLPSPTIETQEFTTRPAMAPTTMFSFKTEHGLFLTWQMIAALGVSLLCGAFGGRIIYLKQKRKWMKLLTKKQNIRDQQQQNSNGTNTDNSNNCMKQNDENYICDTGPNDDIFRLKKVTRDRSESLGMQYKSCASNVPHRSMSLPVLTRSLSSSNILSFLKNPQMQPYPVISSVKSSPSRPTNVVSANFTKQATTATAAATSDLHKTEQPSTPSPQAKANGHQQEHKAGVTTIAGMPFVRYSRYHSEFEEHSSLGKGGFGTVFRCTNLVDGMEYAIKKIYIKSSTSTNLTKTLQRVLREVKILALLNHPNIVRYYTAWLEMEEDDGEEESAPAKDLFGFSSEMDSPTTLTMMPPPQKASLRLLNSQHRWAPSSGMVSLSDCSKVRKPKNGIVHHDNNPLGNFNILPTFPSFSEDESSSSYQSRQIHRRNSTGSSNTTPTFHHRHQNSNEEDLGFNWERSESEIKMDSQLRLSSSQHNQLNFDRSFDVATEEQSVQSDDSDSDSSSTSSSSSESFSTDDPLTATFRPISNDCSQQNGVKSHSSPLPVSSLNHTQSQTNIALPNHHPSSSQKEKSIQSPANTHETPALRYILYIQMQFCSQNTLADFLASPEERGGISMPSNCSNGTSDIENAIDIPYALKLFSQIARGVKHVHSMGLIHRDLKPSNCFIDNEGVLKIGDFGLSRESSTSTKHDLNATLENDLSLSSHYKQKDPVLEVSNASNTAGIGTRSYASPEQMNGSDYNATTDVYSLGIMLFEMCYPMYTGMERYLTFKDIRKQIFPKQWHSTIATNFPSLHSLLKSMLSPSPSKRPSSASVADHINSLLKEYTIQSLNYDIGKRPLDESVLLRVEANTDAEGVLQRTINLIKEASMGVSIVQYGLLRGQESKTVMEFEIAVRKGSEEDGKTSSTSTAVATTAVEEMDDSDCCDDAVQNIFEKLQASHEIQVVRRVNH